MKTVLCSRSYPKKRIVPKPEDPQLSAGSQNADGSQPDGAQATPKPRRRKAGDPPDYREPPACAIHHSHRHVYLLPLYVGAGVLEASGNASLCCWASLQQI